MNKEEVEKLIGELFTVYLQENFWQLETAKVTCSLSIDGKEIGLTLHEGKKVSDFATFVKKGKKWIIPDTTEFVYTDIYSADIRRAIVARIQKESGIRLKMRCEFMRELKKAGDDGIITITPKEIIATSSTGSIIAKLRLR